MCTGLSLCKSVTANGVLFYRYKKILLILLILIPLNDGTALEQKRQQNLCQNLGIDSTFIDIFLNGPVGFVVSILLPLFLLFTSILFRFFACNSFQCSFFSNRSAYLFSSFFTYFFFQCFLDIPLSLPFLQNQRFSLESYTMTKREKTN